jgi:HK97 family phage major capsid protein
MFENLEGRKSEIEIATDRFYRTGDRKALAPFQIDEKAMSIGTNESGGFTHVPQLDDQIIDAIGEAVPVFKDVRKVKTDSNEYRQIFTVTAPTAARAAESGTRNATDTPVIARVDVKLFDLYAYATVSQELLDSSNFDISRYLTEQVEMQFGAALEVELITGAGTGSQECLGINTQATSTASDTDSPQRAFGTYQRINLGINSPISTFDYDGLAQLAQAVPLRYRRGSKFYGSQTAIQAMRQFADGQNRPIWVDSGGVTGRPQSIMGYGVEESSALPTVAFGNQPLFFGNLDQAYLFASHERGIRVIRDEISVPGSVKFYISMQCGGMPGDTRALKALHIA